jgi:hypothetical protein
MKYKKQVSFKDSVNISKMNVRLILITGFVSGHCCCGVLRTSQNQSIGGSFFSLPPEMIGCTANTLNSKK